MSWIKLTSTLPRSPKVRQLARALGCPRHAALGVAVEWLSWLDTQTPDGRTHLLPDEVDDELGVEGAASALLSIGWASFDDESCLIATDFEKHNGSSAKKRAETALRVAKNRSNAKGVTEPREICNAKSVTSALPREEKSNIEKEVCSNTSVNEGGEVPTPLPSAEFKEFLRDLCEVHPAAAKLRFVPGDALEVARQAYDSVQLDEEDISLLKAYYKADIPEGRGIPQGWRPAGLTAFFGNLPDIIAHAENWAKWAGWRSKKRKGAKKAPAIPADGTPAMSPEEATSMLREGFNTP